MYLLCPQSGQVFALRDAGPASGRRQVKAFPLPCKVQAASSILLSPSIDKSTYGFGRLKCAHAALKPLRIRRYALRTSSCMTVFELCQNCEAPVSRQFSSDFRLSSMQVGCRPSKRKRRKAPKRDADRRVSSCQSKAIFTLCTLCGKAPEKLRGFVVALCS